MRDDDLTFVELVQRDLHSVRWPEPAEIRARARRRSRRTVVAAALAVLAVASGTALVEAGRAAGPTSAVGDGGPTGTVAASPVAPAPSGRADIPEAVLLEPRDLTVKTGVRLGDTGLAEPVRVDRQLESCAREQGIYLQPTVSRYSRSRILLRPVAGASGDVPVLSQDVYRVDPPWGLGLFGDIDRMLAACPQWQTSSLLTQAGRTVTAETEHRWEPAVTGFAGDQSVMLRHVTDQARDQTSGKAVGPAGSVDVTLVVRLGDLVTVIVPGPGTIEDRVDGSGPGLSYAQLEALGRVAARRLCGAANPGC
ncbi:hypothetical protein [Micromonospora sp. NPDC005707]|uniref:hypothetical protein n=1 Tax=Micromonospora sp. NPDC005707 TaxID=3157050 RepID=UPI0033E65AAC